jgi:ketosteroid isomerase-like protein
MAAFLGALFFVPLSSVAAEPPAPSPAEAAALGRLENEWIRAVRERDFAALERLLAPDFAFTVAVAGKPLSTIDRDAYVARARGYTVRESRFDEIVVRLHGDVAVVTARYVQKAALHGRDRSAEFVLTDTWVRRGATWVAVARTSSRPEHPAS